MVTYCLLSAFFGCGFRRLNEPPVKDAAKNRRGSGRGYDCAGLGIHFETQRRLFRGRRDLCVRAFLRRLYHDFLSAPDLQVHIGRTIKLDHDPTTREEQVSVPVAVANVGGGTSSVVYLTLSVHHRESGETLKFESRYFSANFVNLEPFVPIVVGADGSASRDIVFYPLSEPPRYLIWREGTYRLEIAVFDAANPAVPTATDARHFFLNATALAKLKAGVSGDSAALIRVVPLSVPLDPESDMVPV